jgi:2-keto-4-pentenoate hydratase/2-oxohepta-3-ene-1,7-dioic acid hydratase in catechol pathway
MLRAYATIDGERRLYQEGSVATMRPPAELIQLYTRGPTLTPGTAMFCGTLAVHGGIAAGGSFEMELEDPVLGRKLGHHYSVVCLPDEG